jgi:hypothetical protein
VTGDDDEDDDDGDDDDDDFTNGKLKRGCGNI